MLSMKLFLAFSANRGSKTDGSFRTDLAKLSQRLARSYTRGELDRVGIVLPTARVIYPNHTVVSVELLHQLHGDLPEAKDVPGLDLRGDDLEQLLSACTRQWPMTLKGRAPSDGGKS